MTVTHEVTSVRETFTSLTYIELHRFYAITTLKELTLVSKRNLVFEYYYVCSLWNEMSMKFNLYLRLTYLIDSSTSLRQALTQSIFCVFSILLRILYLLKNDYEFPTHCSTLIISNPARFFSSIFLFLMQAPKRNKQAFFFLYDPLVKTNTAFSQIVLHLFHLQYG